MGLYGMHVSRRYITEYTKAQCVESDNDLSQPQVAQRIRLFESKHSDGNCRPSADTGPILNQDEIIREGIEPTTTRLKVVRSTD